MNSARTCRAYAYSRRTLACNYAENLATMYLHLPCYGLGATEHASSFREPSASTKVFRVALAIMEGNIRFKTACLSKAAFVKNTHQQQANNGSPRALFAKDTHSATADTGECQEVVFGCWICKQLSWRASRDDNMLYDSCCNPL
jgi:hypothetical protein